jgi:peptidoglycan/LPS O-acetylase OafA/YrhL
MIAWRPDSSSWDPLRVLDAPLLMMLSVWLLCGVLLLESKIRQSSGIFRAAIAVLALIGAASYSLYLLHIPLIGLRNLVQNVFEPGMWKLEFQVLWFFIVLWLCSLSYRFVERPFMALGSRQASLRVGHI